MDWWIHVENQIKEGVTYYRYGAMEMGRCESLWAALKEVRDLFRKHLRRRDNRMNA